MSKSVIQEVVSASPNRRKFLKTLGVATAAVTAMGVAAPVAEAATAGAGPTATEVAVLNFALNLEYLEAEFYTYGYYGTGIESQGIGVSGMASGSNSPNGGTTVGGYQVTNYYNNVVLTKAILAQIGSDERAHVTLIRSFLSSYGYTPVAKPNINLGALGYSFQNQVEYLRLARIFEDIGVTAYAGAAYLLETQKVVQTAARILATEAEHVGSIRTQIAALNIPTNTVLDPADIPPPPTGSQLQYLSINPSNGLPALRSVGNVLALAYGGAGLTMGGFFPTGINGAFAGVASGPLATADNLNTFPAGFAS